jgi:hypothetical protein
VGMVFLFGEIKIELQEIIRGVPNNVRGPQVSRKETDSYYGQIRAKDFEIDKS